MTACACPVCEDAGTVTVAVGPIDPFGVPDGTVEAPCPHCPAGDAEAAHRIGRPWRTPSSSSSSQGPMDPTDPRHDDPDATAQHAASGADLSARQGTCLPGRRSERPGNGAARTLPPGKTAGTPPPSQRGTGHTLHDGRAA